MEIFGSLRMKILCLVNGDTSSLELNQISGMGFRKVLEFLVKDFLIMEQPLNKDSILSSSLGNCINEYIDSPQLKTVAQRASWLGNNQVHCLRKYNDKDVDDLKRLINLSVHWILIIQ